ncbi:MAG: sigma-54 dependent transcriptional regulator [Planctomycetota bacterium]
MEPEAISILVVDDEARIREFVTSELTRRGFAVEEAESGEEALDRTAQREFDVVLMDLRLPGMTGLEALRVIRQGEPAPEVIIITGHGAIDTAIEAIRLGAYHYVTKPFKLRELEIHIRKAGERAALERKSRRLSRLVLADDPEWTIVGDSPAVREILRLIEKMAPTDSTVLITGESGTGKELVARRLHHLSARREAPFVAVNCSTFQETLLETELFGHEKGAFTGAYEMREGLFEVADGGTLFLDEIAEMAPKLQVKVLRALQDGEIRRVGSDRPIRVDVRILAATNVDLDEAVAGGRFREDLFYRLNVLAVPVPPLRERPGDVEALVRHFLSTISVPGKGPFTITDRALDALARYGWPGNVRELKNTVERMKILSDGGEVDLDDVPREVLGVESPDEIEATDPETPLADVERRHILNVLRHADNNRTRAARVLGISTRTLYNKLGEYDRDGVLPPDLRR